MFGDINNNIHNFEISNLGSCCIINPKKSISKGINDDTYVSFIDMASVSEAGYVDSSVIKKYLEVKKGYTYFIDNDVIFAKITPCMENGKGGVVSGLKNGMGFGSTEFHVLRAIPQVSNPYWISVFLSFRKFRLEAAKSMTGASGHRRVPENFLKNYPVVLPNIDVQNKFARFVQKSDKLKFEAQDRIRK